MALSLNVLGRIKCRAYENLEILLFFSLVLLEGPAFGERRDMAFLLDVRVIALPMQSLLRKIAQLRFSSFHPLLDKPLDGDLPPDNSNLPLIIREKDIEYQFHRVILYHRLLLVSIYHRYRP